MIFLLYGCATKPVPVERKFPDPAPMLMEKCKELYQLDANKTAITDLLTVVVQNYNLYHQCSNRVDNWQNWYQEQKKIFEKK